MITILFITAYKIGGFFVDWDAINITEEAKEAKLEDEFSHGHLWFMYFLLIFTFLYSGITYFSKKISFGININYCLIAIMPTILFFIIFQPEDIISRPATDLSFFPHWSILGYYFAFFLFGALFFRLENNGQNFIEKISSNNLSRNNVLSIFNNNPKKLVIVFDDIDNMNCGDKNGLISLTKIIREKKTKKQKQELYTNIPVICINNNSQDK